MFRKRGHGQSWSLDVILALVVFVLIIGIFYSLLSKDSRDKTKDLTLESKTVVSNLDSANGQDNNLTIIYSGSIDDAKLESLYHSDYSEIKKQFGIRGDFCIYIVDQNGNLVTIQNSTGDQLGSFGDSDYLVNNMPCGSTLT